MIRLHELGTQKVPTQGVSPPPLAFVTWRRRGQREDTHMTDPHRPPGDHDDGSPVYERESDTGIPRWVKVGGIVLIVLGLLAMVVMLLSGGGHGPGRHGGDPARTPSVGVTQGHIPPRHG